MRNYTFIYILLISVVLSSLSVAQEEKPYVDPSVCKAMIAYNSNEAEYKAGVDVHGKPVVAADLQSSVVQMPEEYSFPLTVDIAEYMGMDIPAGLEGNFRIGEVTLKNDGAVLYNGKPLEGETAQSLKTLCGVNTPAKDKETNSK